MIDFDQKTQRIHGSVGELLLLEKYLSKDKVKVNGGTVGGRVFLLKTEGLTYQKLDKVLAKINKDLKVNS